MGGSRLRLSIALGGVFVALFVAVLATGARETDSEPPPPADPLATYDPVTAGEELPPGYRQLLSRDQIAPIYDPQFTSAGEVDWPGDMLVIGIAGASEAKAYPVTPLNQREMVVDSLEGIPVLVTW